MSPTPSQSSQNYENLLREARAIRGVSLWQDAERRLRKNRLAVASLWLLVAVGATALLTPLLPLQSPIHQNLQTRQLRGPSFERIELGLVERLREFQRELDDLRAEMVDGPREKRAELAARWTTKQRAEHPFRKHWNNPSWFTRQLLRVRVALFGDWCLPSLCGTDNLGRDLLARLCWGARVSLMVGLVATLVSVVIGVSYGATAGYVGGWVDSIMMRIVDVLYSIPFMFVVIFLLTFLTQDSVKARLEAFGVSQIAIFYLAIGAIYWLTMARVVRGQVMSLKNEQFIEGARVIGAGTARIIFRHLIPNVLGIVIVYLTLTIPAVILFESALSFLGLGVSPPDVSLGLLVNEGLQVITPVKIYWWLVLFPGLALALTLFALNFLGDGLRDALDPRMKNR